MLKTSLTPAFSRLPALRTATHAASTPTYAASPLTADSVTLRFGAKRAEVKRDFIVAAATGNIAALKGYLSAGKVDINAQEDENGDTAAIGAAWKGQTEALQLLIDAKADLNIPNKKGETVLSVALKRNNPAIIDLLVAHFTPPEMKDASAEQKMAYLKAL